MTFIRATPDDVPMIEAFLRARAEYVMFPLNNLVQFGLDGDDPRAPRIWWAGGGTITDLLAITKAGMIMPYLPSGAFSAAAASLSGRSVMGVVGPKEAARGIQHALGLNAAPMELDADERHFSLDLGDLVVPQGATHLVTPTEAMRNVLTQWLTDYHITTLGMTPETARKAVPDRITTDIAENRRVILMDGDTPVATTAFNAALPEIVQIGGVYTPKNERNKGHARRAVALHLAQARAKGVTRATLFANAPEAIAAYTAVGFKYIGDWVLAIFATPQVVS